MAEVALPYPIARIWRRSRNAADARNAHDNAWLAWEASVKLLVLADPPAQRAELARGTLGVWVRALGPRDLRLKDAAVLKVHALLSAPLAGDEIPAPARLEVSAREVLDALPLYRNKVVGHGAVKSAGFYLDAAEVLQDGLVAAWRAGLFLPPSRRLVYVATVRVDKNGQPLADMYDLGAEVIDLVDRQGTAVAKDLLSERLYLKEDGGLYTPLHPLVLFHLDRQTVLFFNGLSRRAAQYLDFATGAAFAGKSLEEEFPGVTDQVITAFGAPAETDGSSAPPPPARDESDLGDYRLLGKIGEGAMGEVYLAEQHSTGRKVALKTLHHTRAGDQVAHTRFRREMRALALCEHENVVKILDQGTIRGMPFFVMEYVDGVDLGRISTGLKRNKSFAETVSSASAALRAEQAPVLGDLPDLRRTPAPPAQDGDRFQAIAGVIRDAARGLHHLHELGIVHRDVSPGNVMVTAHRTRAVVMDLGLAALGDQPATFSRTRALGTPLYTAPEQLLEKGTVRDRRVDVYSLGAVLYELLCGRPMFDAEDAKRLQHQIVWTEPPAPRRVERDCPKDLSIICQKATAKEPSQRYATAEAMAADLDRFLDGRPIQARRPTLLYQLRLLARRNKAAAVTAAVAVLAVLAFAVWAQDERTRADLNAKDARRERDNMLRLSDSRRLSELKAEMATLWPAVPDKLGRMRAWREKAKALLENLPIHEKTLFALRLKGTPMELGSPSERLTTQEKYLRELRRIAGPLVRMASVLIGKRAEVAPENSEIARLEAELPAQREQDTARRQRERRYDFGGDVDSRWWHDTVRDLVANLHAFIANDPFAETVASMDRRIAFAETVAEKTITGREVAAKWAEAREAIRKHPKYGGLDVSPQLGLVPLGPDPESTLWEFCHIQSGDAPERDAASTRWKITGDTGIVLVLIPGGTFWMGAQSEDPQERNYDPQANSDESVDDQPVAVTLDAYFLSKYEMTQGQWQRLMGVPIYRDSMFGSLTQPVQQVTWNDCHAALGRLCLVLPTEAQWEYGCRGGTSWPWWTGEVRESLLGATNIADQAATRAGATWLEIGDWRELDDRFAWPAPVDRMRANPFGLHHVHGNVAEWCRDAWGGYAVLVQPADAERLQQASKIRVSDFTRVVRGGSFRDRAASARSAYRNRLAPDDRANYLGCRAARALEP